MFGWIITAAIAVPLIILAVFLFNGKGAFLIAGYNTMSSDKRASYNKLALCRAVGTLLLILSALMFLFPLAMQLDAMWLFWVAFALFMIVTFGFVLYTNISKKFRVVAAPGVRMPLTQGKKVGIAISVGLTVLLLIGLGFMFYYGEKDPVITVHRDSVQISAMYGLTVNFTDISDVLLIEDSMRDIGVGTRTNGYSGAGHALKGNFRSSSQGQVLLFVYASSSPTIQITRSGGVDIFISFRDNETTRNIYTELAAAIS